MTSKKDCVSVPRAVLEELLSYLNPKSSPKPSPFNPEAKIHEKTWISLL
jgi:hypothetical protein